MFSSLDGFLIIYGSAVTWKQGAPLPFDINVAYGGQLRSVDAERITRDWAARRGLQDVPIVATVWFPYRGTLTLPRAPGQPPDAIILRGDIAIMWNIETSLTSWLRATRYPDSSEAVRVALTPGDDESWGVRVDVGNDEDITALRSALRHADPGVFESLPYARILRALVECGRRRIPEEVVDLLDMGSPGVGQREIVFYADGVGTPNDGTLWTYAEFESLLTGR